MRIEGSRAGHEEGSSEDEQSDLGDLAEGSREGRNEDQLGSMDGRTTEEGGQELVSQLSTCQSIPMKNM